MSPPTFLPHAERGGPIDPLCHLGPILTRPQPEDGASFLHSLLLLLRRLDEIDRKLDRIMEVLRNSHCHGVESFQRRTDCCEICLAEKYFDDATKSKFIEIIAGMLKIQTFVAGRASIEDEQGYPKRKVIYDYIKLSASVARACE